MSADPDVAAAAAAGAGPPAGDPDRYVLGPATRLLWRGPDTVHLELGGRGVVVENLPPELVRALVRGSAGPPSPLAADAFAELREHGYLWSPAEDDRTPPTPHLAGELRSLAARHGERSAELLAARRHVSVVVEGPGRAGPHLAALLAAAGVGRVHCTATAAATLHHAVPGGLVPNDEGRTLAVAAHDAIHRAAPDTRTEPPRVGEAPDLTVLAVDGPVDEARHRTLHRSGAAHLPVCVGVADGAIGPLVVPGLTSCLDCADLHRRDRDPLWPMLAAQLTVPPRHGPSSDVAVATLLVAAAAVQILAFLDGGETACLDGSLEIQLPDWRLRRRSRPVHVDCTCARDD